MATINIRDPDDQADYEYEWAEVIKSVRSPKFSFDSEGRTTATRTIDVAWSSFWLIARAIVGYPLGVRSSANGTYISRKIPWSIPFDNRSGKRWLYANRVEVEGLGVPSDGVCIEGADDDATARYETARLTVHYDTRPYDIVSDAEMKSVYGSGIDEASQFRYVSRVARPAGELLTVRGDAYYLAGTVNQSPNFDTALPVIQGVNKIINSANLSLTWHQVPIEAIPYSYYNPTGTNLAVDMCLGKVNSLGFPVTTSAIAQGTLLFMAAEFKPTVSAFGDRIFDVTYMFKHFGPYTMNSDGDFVKLRDIVDNPVGHQHVFRPVPEEPAQSGYYEVLADRALASIDPSSSSDCTNFVTMADGVNLYDWADLNNLFRPATYPV